MYFYMNFMILLFLSSCLMYSFFYKHILLTLISLEFMMINTMYMMYLTMNILKINFNFIFFFLTLSICEGVLGLTLLVYMIRNTGNDYMTLLNLMKW